MTTTPIKKGDKVRVKSLTVDKATEIGPGLFYANSMTIYQGEEATVTEVLTSGNMKLDVDHGAWTWAPEWLELIEAEPVNILDIVRGHLGAKIYSRVHGELTIKKTLEGNTTYPIHATTIDGSTVSFAADGFEHIKFRAFGGEPVLLPAKGETDWSKWKAVREPWTPAEGEIYYFATNGLTIKPDTNDDTDLDRKRIDAHNCFKTQAAAEEAAKLMREAVDAVHRKYE